MKLMRFALVLAVGCGGGGRPATVANTSSKPAAAPVDANPAPPPVVPAAPVASAKPPLPTGTTVGCDRLIDVVAFTSALGETASLTISDVTKQDADAAASCSLVRGGKRLSAAEQKKLLKKQGRLGVLPGDEVCHVTAYCWTIEEPARFAKRCADRGDRIDDKLGGNACVQVVAAGVDDVNSYRLLDDDTGCVLAVRGGPANVDNDQIRACARTARDLIGPGALTP